VGRGASASSSRSAVASRRERAGGGGASSAGAASCCCPASVNAAMTVFVAMFDRTSMSGRIFSALPKYFTPTARLSSPST